MVAERPQTFPDGSEKLLLPVFDDETIMGNVQSPGGGLHRLDSMLQPHSSNLMTTYNLHARAEARSDETIDLVHNRLFGHLRDHSKLCAGRLVPKAPRIMGGNLIACLDLDKFLPGGMSGYVVYKFRKDANVSPSSGEDYISISFEADAGLHRDIIDDFIPSLIQAMGPFMLRMGDERFDEPLVQPNGSIQVGGPRACGCELHPVFFLADWWFEQRYRITLQEGREILEPVAERVTVMEEGLYVVTTRDPVSFEESRERMQRIEERLRLARPGLMKFFRSLFKGRQ